MDGLRLLPLITLTLMAKPMMMIIIMMMMMMMVIMVVVLMIMVMMITNMIASMVLSFALSFFEDIINGGNHSKYSGWISSWCRIWKFGFSWWKIPGISPLLHNPITGLRLVSQNYFDWTKKQIFDVRIPGSTHVEISPFYDSPNTFQLCLTISCVG